VVEQQLAGVSGLRISRLDLLPEHLAGAPHSLPYGGSEFDLIVSCSLLHHLFDRVPYLRAMRRLTARGGAAVIACEPNARACAPEAVSGAWAQPAVLAEWNARLQERHGFARALTADDLVRLLDPATGSLAPRGIAWESSFVEAIPDFRLLWIGTAGLPVGIAPDQHPLDGAVFSGAWVRD
jgi:SAM-dependent methyltransferase